MTRRAVVALALLLGRGRLPAPGGAAPGRHPARPPRFPVFDVGGDYHGLGQGNGVYFDLYGLNAAPKPAMITIQTPGGYGVSLVHRSQFVLGDAEVDTNRGAYKGEFEVAPRAAFDSDPATAGCADGTHAATWWMVLNGTHGELSVPVAVDRRGHGLRAHGLPRLAAEAAADRERGLLRDPRRVPQPDEARQLPLQRDGDPAAARTASRTRRRATSCAARSRSPRTRCRRPSTTRRRRR